MSRTFFESWSRRIVVGLEGPSPTNAERRLLGERPPAGVLLFERNLLEPAQSRNLTAELREILASRGVPPLILVDHEGGVVSPAHRVAGTPPAPLALGALQVSPDPGEIPDLAPVEETARRVARETARRLRGLGMTGVLAPVLDLSLDPLSPVIGARSLGSNPARVARLARSMIQGYGEAGVACCAKHFPGHGATAVDSHLSLPRLEAGSEELWDRELVPFRAAVEAGVDAIMTGHLALRDQDLPASVSPWAIRFLLRGKMGFDGVVMTDAVEMEGLREEGDLAEATARALEAGNDLVVSGLPLARLAPALEVDRRVEVPWASRSGERLVRMGSRKAPADTSGGDEALYARVDRSSAALVRDPGNVLPLGEGDRVAWCAVADRWGLLEPERSVRVLERVLPRSWRRAAPPLLLDSSDAAAVGDYPANLDRVLGALGVAVSSFGASSGENEPSPGAGETSTSTAVVFLVSRGPVSSLARIQRALEGLKRCVVVGVGWPGLAAAALGSPALVLAWHPGEEAVAGAVAAVRGEIPFTGGVPLAYG
jgi:beta-glucosidase-like glycosyl hydrolase